MTLKQYYDSYYIMHLRYQEFDDFLAFNKPFATRTHMVSDGQFGFVEFLSEKLNKPLWVVHRLDKDTSGLILFAKSKETAAEIKVLFEEHKIKKTYLFLTDAKKSESAFKITSHIEKVSEFFVNAEGSAPNSEPDFEYVKPIGRFHLWKALPKTGKPHQIRLHAQKAGIPILGDKEHGGSVHHRLALHAAQLEFQWKGKSIAISNDPPPFVSLLEDCYYGRHAIYEISTDESYRLIHSESELLRADVFCDRLWIYDYTAQGLSNENKAIITSFAKEKKLHVHFRHMLDRGQGVGGLEKKTLDSNNLDNWVAKEESTTYQMKVDSGFSPGLFLDQRENRAYIRQHSLNRKFLNLFSYTSGFSVQAALGGAKSVTTVDVSNKFLEWSRENFNLNGLPPDKYEFFSQDTILFLKGSIKRGRKWDLIVCDPPSFGRSKENVWKIERDLPELAELVLQCLERNGTLLFTCNFEKKTRDEIIKLFSKNINSKSYKIERMPMLSLDYELTDDYKNLMKGFLLHKI
jgi:23S rRNA (cytosine1962-C5)-methyltransferase